MRAQHFCLASVYIFFSKCNIISYCENTVSDYFFLYLSQPKYFFSKFSIRLFFLAKNHAPPFRLNGRSLNCIGCVFNFKLKQRKSKNRKRDQTASHAQALVSFKKYMPPPLPYFKVNICPFPFPHFASIFFAYL